MFSSIILAAGKSKRMKSKKPKVFHKIGGAPLLWYPINLLKNLKCKDINIVINKEMKDVENFVKNEFDGINIFFQNNQLGTANAVKSVKKSSIITNFQERTLILYGDVPLLKRETIENFIKIKDPSIKIKLLAFRKNDPKNYGRLIIDEKKNLIKVVEEIDATSDEKKIGLCNSGILYADTKILFELLDQIKNKNMAGEFYLTDIIEIAYFKNIKTTFQECNENETMGINTRKDLAFVEEIFQNDKRSYFLDNGVTLKDPKSVYFSYDTQIGVDSVIQQNVIIGENVIIKDNCNILPFSHLEGCTIESNTSVGPFARLRPNTLIEKNCKIGNFVEVKEALLKEGTKVNHLSYIGDAKIEENVNIGAGTIFCNFDGNKKNKTFIGKNSFIGSNSSLVAPVNVGKNVVIGSGSVITNNIPSESLSLSRVDQKNIPKSGQKILNRKKLK